MKHTARHSKKLVKHPNHNSKLKNRLTKKVSNKNAFISMVAAVLVSVGIYVAFYGNFESNKAIALTPMGPSGATGSQGSTPAATLRPTVIPTEVPVSNFIQNGGFEVDANNDGKPDSWGSAPWFNRTNTVVHSGGFSGMFSSQTPQDYGVVQVVNGIVPGKVYNFSSWVNIPVTMKNFRYAIKFIWLNAKGNSSATKVIDTANKATNGWVFVGDETIKAPSNAVGVIIELDINNLLGTFYVDDVVFN